MQTESSTHDPLDSAFAPLALAGWRIEHRTPTVLQLVKPKSFNPTEGVLLALVCGALVLLAGAGGILLAILLVLGDLVWYACRRDATLVLALGPDGGVRRGGGGAAYLTPAQQAKLDTSGSYSRSIGACSTCGALLGGRARCPRCGKAT